MARPPIDRGRAVGLVIIALVLAAFWACVGWGVAQAVGAPGVQATSDRTAAWLTVTLGVEVEPRRAVVTHALAYPGSAAEVWSDDLGVYRLRPDIARDVAARRPFHVNRRLATLRGLHVVTHELLHRRETVPCWTPGGVGLNAEEGIVDALAVDVLPALAWRLYGERWAFVPVYPREVAAIRAASRFATGARSWRERAPRLWRRALWREGCEGRARMLAEAEAARG